MAYATAASASARSERDLVGDDEDGEGQHAARRKNSAGSRRRPRRSQNADRVDPAGHPLLRQQERRDQEPADDEEDLDAEETARQPAQAGVVGDDREHRDARSPSSPGRWSDRAQGSLRPMVVRRRSGRRPMGTGTVFGIDPAG